jgi:membrane-bound lytic murein transglycosylase D
MKRLKKIGGIVGLFVVSGALIHSVSYTKPSDETEVFERYYPAAMDFAGEKTPLELADVKERFDRELIVNSNLDASTLIIIKRANREFPIIEPILKKYGVPDDFKYLAVAESALFNATSSAGAKGFWQFMPATAKERGMEVTDEVDERYHLVKSTEAACQYLLNAKEKMGSWTLAAASYNGGLAGVNRQITSQGENNYYDLLLTEETYRYVFRILALKEVMQHPALYGFTYRNNELYNGIPTRKIEVDSSIADLAAFAKEQGINYKILKIHNPWLRDKKLTNSAKKKYVIEIPTSGY